MYKILITDPISQQGLDILEQGEGMPVPEDIETYMKYNYREMIEETAQDD